MGNDRKIIDPNDFPDEWFPIVVLANELRSIVSWGIKARGDGNYNHEMWLYKRGIVASQDFTGYKRRKLLEFQKPNTILKFWRIKDMTAEERATLMDSITKDLDAPWWKRRYDPIGIVGQLFGIRWIQSPWGFYCSERVACDLRKAERLKIAVKCRPSPSDSNSDYNKAPGIFECPGYWMED